MLDPAKWREDIQYCRGLPGPVALVVGPDDERNHMLVLTRKLDQEIVIEGGITIRVIGTHADKVKLGITAPRELRVDRAEVSKRREMERQHWGGDDREPNI